MPTQFNVFTDQGVSPPGTTLAAQNLDLLIPSQSCLVSGGIPALSGTLTLTQPATVANYNAGTSGSNLQVASQSLTLAASKDTYVDLVSNGTGGGTYTQVAVANNAAAPAVTAGSVRLYKAVANASQVTSVTQLAPSAVLPAAAISAPDESAVNDPVTAIDTLQNTIHRIRYQIANAPVGMAVDGSNAAATVTFAGGFAVGGSSALHGVTATTATFSGALTAQAGLTVSAGTTSVQSLTAAGAVAAQAGLTVSGGATSVAALSASGTLTGTAATFSGLVTAQAGLTVSAGATSLQGALQVGAAQGGNTYFAPAVSLAGNTAIAGYLSLAGQNAPAPAGSVTALAAAGTGATASRGRGTDAAGQITVTAGSGAAAGAILRVTLQAAIPGFAASATGYTAILITAANLSAAGLPLAVYTVTATSFDVYCGTPLTNGIAYTFNYLLIV